jgi:hypothetical protein|tara:strand:+ start:306 stop:1061 length:756 start_codon:yes stop_codon:yes gene_type:complete
MIKLKDLLENKKVTPTNGEINSVTRIIDKAKSLYKKASTHSKGGMYDLDMRGSEASDFDELLPGWGSKIQGLYIVHDNKLNKTFAVGGKLGGGYNQRNSFETACYAEIKNNKPVGGVEEFDKNNKPPLNFNYRLNISGIEKEDVTRAPSLVARYLSQVLYRYDKSITKPEGNYRKDVLNMEKQISLAVSVYTNPAFTGEVKVPEASAIQSKITSKTASKITALSPPEPGADSRAVAEWALNTWNQYLAQLK